MNRDWTDKMKDKLSESSLTPPDDLWAGISSDLDAAFAMKRPRRRYTPWLWSSVAACLAAVIVCGIYLFDDSSLNDSIIDIHTEIALASDVQHKDVPNIDKEPELQKQYAPDEKRSLHKPATEGLHTESFIPNDQTSDTIATATEINVESQQVKEDYDTIDTPQIDYEKLLLAQAAAQNPPVTAKEIRKHISVSLYASNTRLPGLNNGERVIDGQFAASSNDPYETDKDPTKDDKDKVKDENNASESRSESTNSQLLESRHKQPMRFGLSLRIPLSGSFSLSTGVVYSLLSSTLYSGKHIQSSYETEQTLHYIGIPVAVNYSLPSYRSLGFYLTSGAMAEKCIYGQSKLALTANTEHVTERRLQYSLFAGAGMQLNITEHVALYAEPLMTCYLNNHSSVTNVYKDRPLNFDLRMGVLFSF